MTRFSAITATGLYVPPREVHNDVLRARLVPSTPGFINKLDSRPGIMRRWHAEPDKVTSDLVVAAAAQALEQAGLQPTDLDLIVVGTDSPDTMTPATSVFVQHKLGATGAGTFDIGCACASFPTGLATAAGIMATNSGINNVLVAGAYMMQKLADHNDPSIFFYGDGAGAVILQSSQRPGYLGSTFYSDGSLARNWGIYSGGTLEPATHESIDAGRTNVRVVDRYPPEVNREQWPKIVRRLAAENHFDLGEVAHFIFTQVNRSTIEEAMEDLGQPMERAHMIMDRYGYTGSACIPMALHDAAAQGLIKSGDLVVMVGSGVGFNLAATAVRWQ